MARQPRIEGEGLIHHVTGHSIVEQAAFPDDRARRGFLSLLAATAHALEWRVLAYCLLATHYHVLLRTDAPNLGTGMRTMHARHAAKLNARLGRRGHLWRDRYHSRIVVTAAHVVRAAAYVDANPVAAGICDDPADWPWSSYRANAGLAMPWSWHRTDLLYDHMGAAPDDVHAVYRDLVAAAVERSAASRVA
jgi:REP element-mobilizing transposase RayT